MKAIYFAGFHNILRTSINKDEDEIEVFVLFFFCGIYPSCSCFKDTTQAIWLFLCYVLVSRKCTVYYDRCRPLMINIKDIECMSGSLSTFSMAYLQYCMNTVFTWKVVLRTQHSSYFQLLFQEINSKIKIAMAQAVFLIEQNVGILRQND